MTNVEVTLGEHRKGRRLILNFSIMTFESKRRGLEQEMMNNKWWENRRFLWLACWFMTPQTKAKKIWLSSSTVLYMNS